MSSVKRGREVTLAVSLSLLSQLLHLLTTLSLSFPSLLLWHHQLIYHHHVQLLNKSVQLKPKPSPLYYLQTFQSTLSISSPTRSVTDSKPRSYYRDAPEHCPVRSSSSSSPFSTPADLIPSLSLSQNRVPNPSLPDQLPVVQDAQIKKLVKQHRKDQIQISKQ